MKLLHSLCCLLIFPLTLSAISLAAETATFNAFDWEHAQSEDIEQFKAVRNAFFKSHAAGKSDAVNELDAQAGRVDGNQNDFDVRYYGIHLSIDFSLQQISGFVDYRIESLTGSLTEIDLNLRDELSVDSVLVAGVNSSFSHSIHLLSINLPSSYSNGQTVEMQVFYHGTPYYDGSAGMGFTSEFGTQLCWTKATPYRSRYWWPCKDYPADKPDSVDLYMEFPDQYDIATNGIQVSSTNLGNGRKLEHWKHAYPIATYCVAFCVTDYVTAVQDWTYDNDTIPFLTYSMPGNNEAMTAFQTYGPQVLTILSDLYGEYPFITEKMGHADFGWVGAMEHQTFCMYSTDFHTDWVIAHESGHQWWGDMITCKTFNHIWINEGFASYTESLYYEETQGTTAYHNYMNTQEYLGPGSIFVENLVYAEIYDNNLTYNKSSWVLHMLRGVLGDSLFFQSVRDFGNSQFRFGGATTEDFAGVVSATVGSDISWFTNEWIYGEGHPTYEYGWECTNDGGGAFELSLFVIQTQSFPTTYAMPIKMRLVTTGGVVDTTWWNDGRFTYYQVPSNDSIIAVVLDPEEWILKEAVHVPFGVKVATRILPDAPEGKAYSQSLSAVGGTPPYSWLFFGGDIPIGMSFNPTTATISGTPTYQATFYFTIVCKDSSVPQLADTISYSIEVTPPAAMCGDANGDGSVAISDAVSIINYIFGGGPPPDPLSVGDPDCSGNVSIGDAVYLINYIFGGGPAPCASCK